MSRSIYIAFVFVYIRVCSRVFICFDFVCTDFFHISAYACSFFFLSVHVHVVVNTNAQEIDNIIA